MALDTCNRTEWVAVGENPAWVAQLMQAEAIHRLATLGPDAEPPRPFVYVGEEAASHVLRVAIGLESLARGEHQIAGQVHDSFTRAREENTIVSSLPQSNWVANPTASQTVADGPPCAETFLIEPPATYAIQLPSGEKHGACESSLV